MNKYTIFLEENNKFYPVYKQGEHYWLGGSRVEWLLFKTIADAKREFKKVIKQKSPYFEKGNIVIRRCKLQPDL